MSARYAGILAITACALCWGGLITGANHLQATAGVTFHDVMVVEALGTVMAGLVLSGVRWRKLQVSSSHWSRLFILGLFAAAVAPLCFYPSLDLTSQNNASLLAHTQVIFIVLISWRLLRQLPTRRFWFGMAVVLLASAMVTSRSLDKLLAIQVGNRGDALALTSALAWAIGAVVGKGLTRHLNSASILFWRGLIGVGLLLVVNLLVFNHMPTLTGPLLALATLAGIGFTLYYIGLKRLSVSELSLFELATPVFALVFGALFLEEFPSTFALIGSGILLGGLGMLVKE